MSSNNTGQFDKYWRAFRSRKGLVIDVRGNGGGWTEYFIIDKLERKMVAHNTLRGMVPFRYPGSITTGPIAVVTNEYNGSDGEAFLEHFKARKLGTVVGVPSWGGLVGIINGRRRSTTARSSSRTTPSTARMGGGGSKTTGPIPTSSSTTTRRPWRPAGMRNSRRRSRCS